VSVTPPNSVESDDAEHGDGGSEVRLSQSDVHIGLPGDACETAMNAGDTSLNTEIAVSDGSFDQGPSQPRADTAVPTSGTRAEACAVT